MKFARKSLIVLAGIAVLLTFGLAGVSSAFPVTYYWKPRHTSNKCITAHGGVSKGAKIDQYTCVGQGNQRFYISSTGITNPPLYYVQSSTNSGLCLDVPGGSYAKGTQLVLWTCHGRINQQFWFICSDVQNKNCQIRPAKGDQRGKCLSVRGGSSANNAPLVIWSCNGAADQRFDFSR